LRFIQRENDVHAKNMANVSRFTDLKKSTD
jgi:hypothetical protein